MAELQNVLIEWAWQANGIGLLLILATRFLANTKATWAGVGCILLITAIGNAGVLMNAGLTSSQSFASLFGLAVLGSLGSRFVGNWLTDGAT